MSAARAPYRHVSYYRTFLDTIHRQRVSKITKEWVRLNVAKGDESLFIAGLRFLGLINETGVATEKLRSLFVVGDEFKRNLERVVRDAYSDLLKEIVIERATPETLINYFIEKYGYDAGRARGAAKIFAYLANEAGIPLPEALLSLQVPSPIRAPRKAEVPTARVSYARPTGKVPFLGLEGDFLVIRVPLDLEQIQRARRYLDFWTEQLRVESARQKTTEE